MIPKPDRARLDPISGGLRTLLVEIAVVGGFALVALAIAVLVTWIV